ncbi:hypothetical protein [Noviherbaspirillum malthae]|uniref:hypothetical protein n=1 Tax=Noviherbaspirillum malthae TaxID=1260987 RepID=UPI00188F7CBC|nr:hypothetical protein [Noviherbaspirillum malthae]
MNAVTHGVRSSKLLLPNENPQEYQALLQSLIIDLKPVGALEQLLVDKIAGAAWRRLRMEGAEYAILTNVQMHPVSDRELKDALDLWNEKQPDWMTTTDEFGNSILMPLPDWMREQKNMPSPAQGVQAEGICREWGAQQDGAIRLEEEEDARRQCPLHWRFLQAEVKKIGSKGDPALTLKLLYNADSFTEGFVCYMEDQYKAYYWVAYCHRHREKVKAAFGAIRSQRMLKAWDPEKSHRYTTMLDNQLFKLLREFREMRAWRLDNLDMMNLEAPTQVDDAEIVTEPQPRPASKKASSRRRKPS